MCTRTQHSATMIWCWIDSIVTTKLPSLIHSGGCTSFFFFRLNVKKILKGGPAWVLAYSNPSGLRCNLSRPSCVSFYFSRLTSTWLQKLSPPVNCHTSYPNRGLSVVSAVSYSFIALTSAAIGAMGEGGGGHFCLPFVI